MVDSNLNLYDTYRAASYPLMVEQLITFLVCCPSVAMYLSISRFTLEHFALVRNSTKCVPFLVRNSYKNRSLNSLKEKCAFAHTNVFRISVTTDHDVVLLML